MGKILGFGKGQQGNTLRLNYKNFFAEIGLQNGKFVFMVNNEVVHNLGTMQTDILSKSNSASPTFTGTVTTPAIILSGETASTIASLDASKNVKSLAVSTYPSLTELSYVKGLTSAVQTQIGLKSNAASPVFTGQMTGAFPIYDDISAAKAAGLTIGQVFQITTTGTLTVVNS